MHRTLFCRVDATLAYWRGVYWVGHLSLPLLYLATLLGSSLIRKPSTTKQE
jgi:hypothetical protein